MAYSDGLIHLPGGLMNTASPSYAVREVEAVAADLATYRFPYPVLIEGLAFLVTETFAVHAVDPVFSLDWSDKDVARTEILTVTIGSALKRGNGSKAAQTALVADSDIVANDVVVYNGPKLPFRLPAGATLFVEHKTAAGEVGGAVVPVVLARAEGYELQATRILS